MSAAAGTEPQFKGVWIDAAIWLSPLTWQEKCLLAQINVMDKGQGCWAADGWLGERFGVCELRMRNMISGLRKKGWLVDRGRDGRNRWISVNPDRLCTAITKSVTSDITQGVTSDITDSVMITDRVTSDITESVIAVHKGKNKRENTVIDQPSLIEIAETLGKVKGDAALAFDRFWAEYPRREGRKKALEVFRRNKLHERLEEVLQGLQRAKASEQWQNPRFIPHATTWLNGERWLDDAPTSLALPRPQGAHVGFEKKERGGALPPPPIPGPGAPEPEWDWRGVFRERFKCEPAEWHELHVTQQREVMRRAPREAATA